MLLLVYIYVCTVLDSELFTPNLVNFDTLYCFWIVITIFFFFESVGDSVVSASVKLSHLFALPAGLICQS